MIGLLLCPLVTELPPSCVVDGSRTEPCARCKAPVWLAAPWQNDPRRQTVVTICRNCFDLELAMFREAAIEAAREVRS